MKFNAVVPVCFVVDGLRQFGDRAVNAFALHLS